MEGLYQWIVLLHVIAALTFALAHGVSAGVALKLRGERDIPRVQALAAIVLLVLIFAAMHARASAWFAEVRGAAGQAWYKMGKGPQPAGPPDLAKLATLTASSRPMEIDEAF